MEPVVIDKASSQELVAHLEVSLQGSQPVKRHVASESGVLPRITISVPVGRCVSLTTGFLVQLQWTVIRVSLSRTVDDRVAMRGSLG
jgi:hypothetical protein